MNTAEMICHVIASKARLESYRNSTRFIKCVDLINCSVSDINVKNTALLLPFTFK